MLAAEGLNYRVEAYQGVGHPVRVPVPRLPAKSVGWRPSTAHAKICCVGEQITAVLKRWHIPRRLRCSTTRITDLVKATLVLHHAST